MNNPAPINFFKGHPSYRLLPGKRVAEAATQLLSPDKRDFDNVPCNRHPLTYGSDEGALWVRQAICDFSNHMFGLSDSVKSKPEFINLTGGASYGVMNILEQTTLAHTGYTRQAFIISPTYFLINETFIDAGFNGKLTAINELGDSIDFETLKSKLEHFDSIDDGIDHSKDLDLINSPSTAHPKKIYKYVLYFVPTYSNPGGKTYNLETRLKLIDLARKHDMLIISDDVYDLLNYEQPLDTLPHPIQRLAHLDRSTYTGGDKGFGNTVSNATFSKLIAPGLRFGYQESVNKNLVYQLCQGGANVSGGTPSQLNSMIVGTMLKNGSAKDIMNELRATYKERCDVLYSSIKKHLPSKTVYEKQTGGYFSWCTLPEGYNCQEICQTLEKEHGVVLANGSCFEVIGDAKNWGETSVRLSISFMELSEIEEGIRLWGQVCKEYASKNGLKF